jgi:quercetin dioxygenase-like cupin family protein
MTEFVEDPVLRQRYRLSREGDILRVELWAEPGAGVPVHFHPQIEERFEVLQGEFTFRVDGAKQRAGPGDRLVAEAGSRHAFKNTGEGVAHFVAEVDPALNMQDFFEESAALARAGMFLRPGIPKGPRGLLAAAEFADRYSEIFQQTFPPRPLQRILIPPLARLERRRRAKRR